MRNIKGTTHCILIIYIIKFKRMHGLNYMSFGEQMLFKIVMMMLHVMRMRNFKEKRMYGFHGNVFL